MRLLFLILTALLLAACDDGPDATPADRRPADTLAAASSPEATPPNPVPAEQPLTILYLGDSLTAGYGLAGGPDEAYPALIQARLDSLGIPARTVNAGVSGDTSAGGLSRIGWYLDRYEVDVLVLALGANDGLRGLPPDALRRNLETIIDRARASNPDMRIVLAGMMIPPSMGAQYFERFSQVYPDVAEAKDVEMVPFLLDRVAGIPSLNQADGVHPTASGQRIMAETVWETLRPVVEETYAEGTV